MTSTRRVTSPATGRGVTSGGEHGRPSAERHRASPMRSIAAASLTKSNSSASCASSSEKTTARLCGHACGAARGSARSSGPAAGAALGARRWGGFEARARTVLEVGHVAQQLGLDRGPLHLDRDHAAAVGLGQRGAVHLRDGGRAERLDIEAGEDVVEGLALLEELLRHDGLDQLDIHRVEQIGQPAQRLCVLPREEVLPRCDDLTDLDVEALEVVDRLGDHHGTWMGVETFAVLILPEDLARLLVETLAEKPLASLESAV
eukprot:scaffold100071_cov69-Phaeocystis_antarctica.AAC.3